MGREFPPSHSLIHYRSTALLISVLANEPVALGFRWHTAPVAAGVGVSFRPPLSSTLNSTCKSGFYYCGISLSCQNIKKLTCRTFLPKSLKAASPLHLPLQSRILCSCSEIQMRNAWLISLMVDNGEHGLNCQ